MNSQIASNLAATHAAACSSLKNRSFSLSLQRSGSFTSAKPVGTKSPELLSRDFDQRDTRNSGEVNTSNLGELAQSLKDSKLLLGHEVSSQGDDAGSCSNIDAEYVNS